MTAPTPNDESQQRYDAAIEAVLDAHAEYYVRQTMKFFQENGESPALSKNNEADLTAKAKLKALMVAERIDELKQVNKVNNSIYSDDPAAYYVSIQWHINHRQAALTAQQPTGEEA